MKLKPRTTFRDSLGSPVCIAGLADREFEGKPVWYSIQGDHYTDDGLFIRSRLMPGPEFGIDSFTTEGFGGNIAREDNDDRWRKWWEGVQL